MHEHYKCPFCSLSMSVSRDTYIERYVSFVFSGNGASENFTAVNGALIVHFHKCPACKKISVLYSFPEDNDSFTMLRPANTCEHYPDYVPLQIRSDYEEACAIKSLSPKASAALSRRCLQGIIRDFWGISEGRLIDEINKLKGIIPDDQYAVFDGVRELGNIAAHMEKDINTIVDIDAGEAELLIKLIELLIKDWYIARYDRKKIYSDIVGINKSKQDARAGK